MKKEKEEIKSLLDEVDKYVTLINIPPNVKKDYKELKKKIKKKGVSSVMK